MQLVVRDLSKRYSNGVQALAAVSLIVPPGMFGLLGPNGAGKSTLMRTLATLQSADSGSVDAGRHRRPAASPSACAPMLGYLPQDFGVYPKVSAYDLLDHLARLKGLADAKSRRETVGRAPASRQPARRAQAEARRLLRRHAPALRHRAGAASATPSSSSSTSRRRASTRKSACASTTCSPTSPPTSS